MLRKFSASVVRAAIFKNTFPRALKVTKLSKFLLSFNLRFFSLSMITMTFIAGVNPN